MIERFVLWSEELEETKMKQIRKCLSLIILLLLTCSIVMAGYAENKADSDNQIPVVVSFNLTRWDRYWKPGEKIMADTEESRKQVSAILDKANQDSEGTRKVYNGISGTENALSHGNDAAGTSGTEKVPACLSR